MSKKPFTHKDYVTGYEYFRNLSQEKDERIKDLEEELDDYHNTEKFVLGEDCPTDENHCGCVVILKKRIKDLEDTFKDVCDLINREGMVSKWRILNRLEKARKDK